MNILHHWNDNLDHILKNTKTPVCYRNQTYEGTVQGTAECKRGKRRSPKKKNWTTFI